MEFYEVKLLNNWYFKIKLPYVDRQRVSYNMDTLKYIYAIRRYVKDKVTDYLYQDEENDGEFIFQIGYASFILNEFYNQLSSRDRELLESVIFSDLELPKFSNLYDYQNQDLKQLVLVKRGMFQCYTGYGKSEIIATLANYIANELHEKVLIVTAGQTALNELKHRLSKLFNIQTSYFNEDDMVNAINLNGYLRSSWYDKDNPYWSNDFWILADEVENCCSESAMEFYETLPNVKHMYGFSATSDKRYADPVYSRVPDQIYEDFNAKIRNTPPHKIQQLSNEFVVEVNNIKSDIRDTLGRNKYLVGYYSTSAVFKKPNSFKISLIDIQSTLSADDIELPSDYEYSEIIYNLYANERMSKLIESVTYKVGLIFIPMFRLQVIDYWLQNIFKKDDFLVLVISSRGYEVYEKGELIDNISLDEVKLLVKAGVIGVILGTKSAYNALDLPQLKRSFLLYSKTANIVIQAIGRTARGGEFEIYSISPMKTIPTYSKDLQERKELIREYYKHCSITEYKQSENIYEY